LAGAPILAKSARRLTDLRRIIFQATVSAPARGLGAFHSPGECFDGGQPHLDDGIFEALAMAVTATSSAARISPNVLSACWRVAGLRPAPFSPARGAPFGSERMEYEAPAPQRLPGFSFLLLERVNQRRALLVFQSLKDSQGRRPNSLILHL